MQLAWFLTEPLNNFPKVICENEEMIVAVNPIYVIA